MNMEKAEYRTRGIHLQTHIFWSERGPTDFWTGPCMVYAIDACNDTNVNLQMSNTSAGHIKFVHDQIIGRTKEKAEYNTPSTLYLFMS